MNPIPPFTNGVGHPDLYSQTPQEFENALNRWVENPEVKGNKKEAARRILNAYKKNLSYLDLSRLNLSAIPAEIGGLVHLEELKLHHNELTSISPEIGNLTALKWLKLNSNSLSAIPPEIRSLRVLDSLKLNDNQLSELPREIRSLQSLKGLYVDNNKLCRLPDEIGSLSALQTLYVRNNQLSDIPPEIGNLMDLASIDFSYNRDLADLPLSLGGLSNITYLVNEGTAIPQNRIEAILILCESLREGTALQDLPDRLNLWQQYADQPGRSYNLEFITELNDLDQKSINEWLVRLSKTRDFRRCQRDLADKVCSMLETLGTNDAFKDDFFVQVQENLSDCQDRAAESLNEIFTCWKLHTINKEDPLSEKLQLIAGVAKTHCLRSELRKIISRHQTERKNIYIEQGMAPQDAEELSVERESVEIFLYYEIALKESLELVTCINHMAYELLGQRSWITNEALITAVNEQYLDEMMQLGVFKSIAEKESSYRDGLSRTKESYNDELDGLDYGSEQYDEKIRELGDERQTACRNFTHRWILENVSSNSKKRRAATPQPLPKRPNIDP